MRWLLRKLDSLTGTILASVGGLVAAQLPVFVQQYVQRLGGHVDEAHRHLARVVGDATFGRLEPAARLMLETSARERLADLERQQLTLDAASPLWRPVAFLQSFDPDIAAAAIERFVPALPLDAAGLVYGGAGIVVTWLLYEVVKLPFCLVRRRRPPSSQLHVPRP